MTKYKYIIPDVNVQTVQEFNKAGMATPTGSRKDKETLNQQMVENLKIMKKVPKKGLSSADRKQGSASTAKK